MLPAAVGFQCPDDVREGARGVRQPRTAFGGALTPDPSLLTTVLVGLVVAVFALDLLGGALAVDYGMLASTSGPVQAGVAAGEWYRLLTAAFLHGGAFHLLSNVFALLTVGPQVEAALGRVRFLAVYLLSALGGSTLSYLLSEPDQLGVGASGAIFGLFGASYVITRRLGGDVRPVATLLAVNLVITIAIPTIDWRAHLGGLAVGVVAAAALARAPAGPRRTAVQAAGLGVLLVVLVVAVLLRTAALQG